MNSEQISFLKDLDKSCMNGTIQSVLMRKDIDSLGFEKALAFLLKQTLNEKNALLQQNTKLRKVLIDNNLYKPELVI